MRMRRTNTVTGLVAVLWLCGAAVAADKPEMTPLDIPMIGDIEMLQVGSAAPAFILEDVNGVAYDFGAESQTKAHLLVFWSIFCEPCKAEMPLIQRLYEEFHDQGFEVLAVAMDGEPMKKSIQGLIKQQGYTFKVFIDKLAADESFVVADPFGVAGTPTLYVVAPGGKVVFARLGRTEKADLEAQIRTALGSK